MVRQTSINTFNKIKSEGLLPIRRWQVYDILYNHGPATGNELLIHFRKKYGTLYGNSPVVTSRLGELRDMGVAQELGTKICSITKQKVIEWDVTDSLPKIIKTKGEFCVYCEKCNQRFKEKPSFHSTKESSLFPCNGSFTRWKKVK